MVDEFEYDVFLSHSSKDKDAVRELAERLKADGLRVWFDKWVIKLGDSIPLAIERGLESSRTLVLVMSQNAFDSEWVTLERHTALFRDPKNDSRRFIPLKLDDSDPPALLQQLLYIDWRTKDMDEYTRLLSACKSGATAHAEFGRRNEAHAIQASDAFKRMIDNDPGLRASLDRLRPKIEKTAAELQKQLHNYKEYFETSFEEPAPNSIEDWTRLATRAGLDPTWILTGEWTPKEVAPVIEGYLNRVKETPSPPRQRTLNPTAFVLLTVALILLGYYLFRCNEEDAHKQSKYHRRQWDRLDVLHDKLNESKGGLPEIEEAVAIARNLTNSPSSCLSNEEVFESRFHVAFSYSLASTISDENSQLDDAQKYADLAAQAAHDSLSMITAIEEQASRQGVNPNPGELVDYLSNRKDILRHIICLSIIMNAKPKPPGYAEIEQIRRVWCQVRHKYRMMTAENDPGDLVVKLLGEMPCQLE